MIAGDQPSVRTRQAEGRVSSSSGMKTWAHMQHVKSLENSVIFSVKPGACILYCQESPAFQIAQGLGREISQRKVLTLQALRLIWFPRTHVNNLECGDVCLQSQYAGGRDKTIPGVCLPSA